MIFPHSESINASEHLPPNPLRFLIPGSATGFYGLDNDGNLIPDRSGIVLAFNHPNVEELIFEYEIWVKVEDGRIVFVAESHIRENLLFIKLAEELASDATPIVVVSRYFHANSLDTGKFLENLSYAEAEINDGILPTLAMTLGGGSGTGTGNEGPDRLTKDKINITVTSDEPLAEPPNITVVCNNIQWTESADSTLIHNNIDNFIANRAGQLTATNAESPDGTYPDYSCGSDDTLTLTTSSMTTISETSWSYEWRNQTAPPSKLNDGLLTAVAHARDQSEYQHHKDGSTVHNWNSATANFTLDTILKSPLEDGGGEEHPVQDSVTHDLLQSVWFKFQEPTTVTLKSIKYRDGYATDDFEDVSNNAWALFRDSELVEPFAPGIHVFDIDASDAAANRASFELTYEVLDSEIASVQRDPFVLSLVPGWNAISFPARPLAYGIGEVFDHPAVQAVFAWHGGRSGEWIAAAHRNGEWQPIEPYLFLYDVWPGIPQRQNNGYWVWSDDFVQLPVQLRWPTIVGLGRATVYYHPLVGWNFVGITAEDRHHQNEVEFGSTHHWPNGDLITVETYLNQHVHADDDYRNAYRWDALKQHFTTLKPDDPVRIGEAIWVYYPEPGGP